MARRALNISVEQASQKVLLAKFKAGAVGDFIDGQSVQVIVAILIQLLSVAFPWMAYPVVSMFVSQVLTVALTQLIQWLDEWFGFNLVDNMVKKQLADYQAATDTLRKIHDDPNATQAQLDAATKDFKSKCDVIFRLYIDGVRTKQGRNPRRRMVR